MPFERIRGAKNVAVGTNQTTKALEQSAAREVYVAKDADRKIVDRIVHLCEAKNTPVIWVDSMKQLGKACGIEVGAAAAAILLD
ncbi:ribosomal L7Ae/L30e/S12e/Gadd45 family protein [Effusibacillus lacus]|uniref:50S ribosomal protein L7A n=1 Tax=Effusibacillus lacus TaxID=1348429 RepID=A0A292YG36_9BACL|nr:ribosomal L7Ae/L30e/S12e/Gadd45 family protein [Effusibacillus lacus]TCS69167.1 large subunit ribosomal protein L7A [Effusibacillus lacus]GAX89327.1 50S ribosomal protein L7A [Effusibacillus lacus]